MIYPIKDRIEELLKEKKETKKALYEFLGMTAPGFDYMVKHSSYTASRLEQIAEFFEMTVDQFRGVSQTETKKVISSESFGNQVADRLLEEFAKLREQLAIKDRQLEAADKRAEGLQRTIDALISRPVTPSGNFLNDVAARRSVIRMHPATQLLVETTGAVA
ncbi:hypothetical protein [Spirosoma litoris]